jgi:putative hydrolase of the HAD superfamily
MNPLEETSMAEVPTLFFDVGGVLLTNGWDTGSRRAAADEFGLDYPEFQTRHEMLKTAFETGRLSLDGYIRKAVFHRERAFKPDEFKAFMFSRSQVLGETLEWVRTLTRAGKCRLFTLNNESRELHEHRVKRFGLDNVFQGFLVSCYLGQAKPDEGIYLGALGIAACEKGDAVFIDDRALNVEPAYALGLNAILFQGLDGLRDSLKDFGITA